MRNEENCSSLVGYLLQEILESASGPQNRMVACAGEELGSEDFIPDIQIYCFFSIFKKFFPL